MVRRNGRYGVMVMAAILMVTGMAIVPTQPGLSGSTWDWIIQTITGKGRGAGTQGSFCAISPNQKYNNTLDPQPVFIWKGEVTQIKVVDFKSNPKETLWETPLTDPESTQQQITYAGKPLQRGKVYRLTYKHRDGQSLEYTFKVLDDNNTQKIQQELAALKAPTKSEEHLKQRIEVFNRNNLLMDMVRETLAFSGNSQRQPEKTAEQIRKESCQ